MKKLPTHRMFKPTVNRAGFCLFTFTLISWTVSSFAKEQSENTSPYETSFEERSIILLEKVANDYKPAVYSDRGKYSFPKTIARMKLYGESDELANQYLSEYGSGKYGFFHFPFVGIARIMYLFPGAPEMEKNRDRFLEDIIHFDPSYQYNAFTGEGTENHVGMSRTNGYLFTQLGKNIPDLKDSSIKWHEQLDEWIHNWSHLIFQVGTGEWDSNVYTAYNLVGWLNLYDFAEDDEIKQCAKAVLDYYACTIALKMTQGIYGGPESRASASVNQLPRTATEYLAWIWFGGVNSDQFDDFFAGGEYIQAVYAATSTYRPPVEAVKLARKEIERPAYYLNTKPEYLLRNAGETQEEFFIGDSFTLGTVQANYGGWTNASYGVINWKLVLENKETVPAIIWGNGGMKSLTNGRGRNPFDQFLQHRNVMVQMTRVPENAKEIQGEVNNLISEWKKLHDRDFQKRWMTHHHDAPGPISNSAAGKLENAFISRIYFSSDLKPAVEDDFVFADYGDSFVAIQPLSQSEPSLVEGQISDVAGFNTISGFVLEVGTRSEVYSFVDFKQDIKNKSSLVKEDEVTFCYTSVGGDKIRFKYSTSGKWEVMDFDWSFGVEEQRVSFNSSDWLQPNWPQGEGHGRIPEYWVNGEKQWASANFPVYNGNYFSLDKGVLKIGKSSDPYIIDYTGETPVFNK